MCQYLRTVGACKECWDLWALNIKRNKVCSPHMWGILLPNYANPWVPRQCFDFQRFLWNNCICTFYQIILLRVKYTLVNIRLEIMWYLTLGYLTSPFPTFPIKSWDSFLGLVCLDFIFPCDKILSWRFYNSLNKLLMARHGPQTLQWSSYMHASYDISKAKFQADIGIWGPHRWEWLA